MQHAQRNGQISVVCFRELCEWTDRQTDSHTHRSTSQPSLGEAINRILALNIAYACYHNVFVTVVNRDCLGCHWSVPRSTRIVNATSISVSLQCCPCTTNNHPGGLVIIVWWPVIIDGVAGKAVFPSVATRWRVIVRLALNVAMSR